MDTEEVLAAATHNLIGWHDTSVRALGWPTGLGPDWWTSPTPSPWIYFTAIQRHRLADRSARTLARAELDAHLDDPRGGFQAVCASYADLDLGSGPDPLALRTRGLWYARAPGPLEVPGGEPPGDLAIEVVRDPAGLAEFELATCAAFGSAPPVSPGDVHHPGILGDPAMSVLVGRRDGRVVSGAMAYRSDGVVGLYGVGTVPGQRGRGYAVALTQASLARAADRWAILQPSTAAARLYRRLGFVEIGAFTHWG